MIPRGKVQSTLASADVLRTPERYESPPRASMETGSSHSRNRWSSPRRSPNVRRRSPYASLNASPQDSPIDDPKENSMPCDVPIITRTTDQCSNAGSSAGKKIPFPSPKRALACFGQMLRKDTSKSPSVTSRSSKRTERESHEINERDSDADESSHLGLKLVSTVPVRDPGPEDFEVLLNRSMQRLKEESRAPSEASQPSQPTPRRSSRPKNPPRVSATFPTPLHEICMNSKSLDEVLHERLILTTQRGSKKLSSFASKTDRHGRTPMHLLSQNVDLAEAMHAYQELSASSLHPHQRIALEPGSRLDERVVRFVAHELLPYYPSSMMIRDDGGHVPFQGALVAWIKLCHENATDNNGANHKTTLLSQLPQAAGKISQVWESTSASVRNAVRQAGMNLARSASEPGLGPDDSSPTVGLDDMENQNPAEESSNDSKRQDEKKFASNLPRGVQLTPHSRYALTLLSAVVEQCDQKAALLKRKASGFANSGDGPIHASSLQDMHGSDDISAAIVQTVASISGLMKIVLLIEDDEDRAFALSTPIMRRVMMCEHSIGGWMTSMLQSKQPHVAGRIIDYLKQISADLSQQDRGGTLNGHKRQRFNIEAHESDGLVVEMSRLPGFIPSLLSLGNAGVEEVSTTEVVRKVLDRMISRPFAVTVIFCDMVFLSALIYGFRSAVDQLLGGGSINNVLQFIYVANTGIFYYVIRETGKIVSLCLMAKSVRRYFLSFWNLTDLLAVVCALAATVYMRYHTAYREKTLDDASFLRGLLAVTTGLLWLRVLSLLKAINMQLATFVLAILNISKDIIWFCVILFTMIVSFAQIFYTMLAPSSCAEGNGNAGVQPQCKQSEYYLGAYTVLLGDFGLFEREDFTSSFSIFVIVLYSFLVTVVLLNVLIAVASDSYEKCLLRSQHLFGRARVMLIAELVSFQHLLSKKEDHKSSNRADDAIYSLWWSSSPLIHDWSRGSILFFGLSLSVVVCWTLAETVGFASGPQHGNLWSSLVSIFVNFVLFIAIIAFLLNASRSSSSKVDPDQDSEERKQCCNSTRWLNKFLQNTMLRLLGSSKDSIRSSKYGTDDWKGRAHYLQTEMERIAAESAEREMKLSQVVESMLQVSESRLHDEIKTLSRGFESLRRNIENDVQTTQETNTLVSLTVDELRRLINMTSNGGESTAVSSVRLNAVRSPGPTEVGLDETMFVRYQA